LQPRVKNTIGRKAWPPLLHRLVRTIRSRDLLRRGQRVLVAVSGGPDSVALLSLLHHLHVRWALTLTAIHCNYGLRGRESEEDQEFVEVLCRQLEVPLYVRRMELPARPHRPSLQAVARDLRYQVMKEVAAHDRADRIAVGHTADDQAETVLLWMLRGAGLTGLSGMPAFRDGNIIRPLYDVRRQDIVTYLNEAGMPFRQDSSNLTSRYVRNRIRHEVIPVLQRLAPSSVNTLCRLAEVCREDDRYLEQQVSVFLGSMCQSTPSGGWAMNRSLFRELPQAVQRRLIRDLLQRSDRSSRWPSYKLVDEVIHMVVAQGPAVERSMKQRGWLIAENDEIRFVPLAATGISQDRHQTIPPVQVLPVPGRVEWPGTGQRIQVQQQAWDPQSRVFGKYCIAADADLVSQPLCVRTWLPGDRFYPQGMGGHSKKLQDYFTDLGMPGALRRQIPLVVAPEGIVWIVGYRQDQRWTPTAKTVRCLVFTVDNAGEAGGRLGLREGTA